HRGAKVVSRARSARLHLAHPVGRLDERGDVVLVAARNLVRSPQRGGRPAEPEDALRSLLVAVVAKLLRQRIARRRELRGRLREQLAELAGFHATNVSPIAGMRNRSDGKPLRSHSARSRCGGSSSGSSVSLKVPQCMATNVRAPRSTNALIACSGFMCCISMNQPGSYAPMGRRAAESPGKRRPISAKPSNQAVSP